jgi:cytochrome c oxidase cbb3-type subunit 3
MASIEKDSISGQNTTGHEWDGIKELNTPLPQWWVWVFWVTVLWAVAYWVVYPAWPTPSSFTRGTFNYSSRGTLEQELKDQKQARSAWTAKIQAASVDEIVKDKALFEYAQVGGKIAFNENCAACHGAGGGGIAASYPNLTDDMWLWGGTLADIQATIVHGVRNEDPASRNSQMPRFGADNMLTAEQVGQVADYVMGLATKSAAAGSPGATLYADNCAACHGAEGAGNKEVGAPPLTTAIRTFHKPGRDGVVDQINNPKHGSMPAWGKRLDDTTVKMLTVYVHSRGGGQ